MFARERKTPIAEWWWTIDKSLLAALTLLLLTGVMLSFAASPPVAQRIGLDSWHFIIRQAMFAALALPVMLATSMLPHRAARWVALIVLVVFTILMWAALRFGVEVKGAKRWISLAGNTIQPSEFVKPAFAVIGAWLFAESMKHKGIPARTMATLIMVMLVAALLGRLASSLRPGGRCCSSPASPG
jgi:cell division protein FtsW